MHIYENKRFLSYDLGKGSILFHPFTSDWLVTNTSGRFISSLLFEGATPKVAADRCSHKYGIPFEQALTDVFSVQKVLKERKFLPSPSSKANQRVPELKKLFLQITRRCNLSCLHCYVGSRADLYEAKELPASLILELIDQLRQQGGQSITLGGGEPLLHSGFREILECGRQHDLELGLLTNGTLVDEELASFLAKRGISVQISIDGSRPSIHDAIRGKGSFEKAKRALVMLREAGLGNKISIATTVMHVNLNDLAGIIRMGQQMGISSVSFLPLRKQGSAINRWERIGEELSREEVQRFFDYVIHRGVDTSFPRTDVSCGLSGFVLKLSDTPDDIWCIIGHQLVVDVKGNAYPCNVMMKPDFSLGNVYEQTLEAILDGRPMKKICGALEKRRFRIEQCAACPPRNLCQGGCMAMALEQRGTIWETDDFCEYRQKLYREAFDRLISFPT